MTAYPSRRNFLAMAGIAAAAAWKGASAKPLGLPIGIQSYTVRNDLAKDVPGTLKKLAAIGYQEVEIGDPFYGKNGAELQKILADTGLVAPAGHYGFPKDDSEWQRLIDNQKSLGVKYLITSAPSEWRNSLDGWKRAAESFNHLGELCRKAGTILAYHNHHFEFKTYEGVTAYDQLLRSTDPELVKMEMDCFWTTFAGKDPLDYFAKYPGRFELLHIKGLKPGYGPSTGGPIKGNPFTEVGNGVIDYKKIFAAAPRAGLKHYFVEQDQCDRPCIESAKISYEYLKNLNV